MQRPLRASPHRFAYAAPLPTRAAVSRSAVLVLLLLRGMRRRLLPRLRPEAGEVAPRRRWKAARAADSVFSQAQPAHAAHGVLHSARGPRVHCEETRVPRHVHPHALRAASVRAAVKAERCGVDTRAALSGLRRHRQRVEQPHALCQPVPGEARRASTGNSPRACNRDIVRHLQVQRRALSGAAAATRREAGPISAEFVRSVSNQDPANRWHHLSRLSY